MIKSNLAVLMAEKGYRTISKISAITGLSRTTLTMLFYGKGDGIRFETMEKLCKLFNCTVGDLLIYQ